MFSQNHTLSHCDPKIAQAVQQEAERQEYHLELIASENYTSPAVLEAQGSIFTNKYAEGYPNKRYYGGCGITDVVEQLAIDRAKALFGAAYVNVQPHSGSSANMAVFNAVLNAGDTILGMSLAHGGHLTHGASVNFSGYLYKAVHYTIDEAGLLDFNQIEDLAKKHKPKMIIGGFSAYSRTIDWQNYRDIADQVGAVLLVDMAHVSGLVAAGLYPSPVSIADVVTSTTHKTLRGPRGGIILSRENNDLTKKINSRIFPGIQGGPLVHAIAAKAVCFKEAAEPAFKTYQQQVIKNAHVMAETFKKRGYEVVSNGTDNHLFLASFVKQDLTGKDVDRWLEDAHITVNKNTVPNDPQSPFITSGIRIGTPAVTTRGFTETDCGNLANWMCDIIDARGDQGSIASARQKVTEICMRLPVYRNA